MKIFLKIVLIAISIHTYSLPQFYTDSVTKDYEIEFWKIADETAKSINLHGKVHKPFSDEELRHIAELYYKCYNDDPVGFKNYISEKHKEFEKAPLDIITGKLKMRPWMKVYALRNQIAKKYGFFFTQVLSTPAFLRGKYIQFIFTDHYIVSLNAKFGVHNFVFIVEEILKGEKFFSVNDTISIQIIPNVESPAPKFIKNKSYLIPLNTLLGMEEDTFNCVFSYLHNDSDGAWIMGTPPQTFPIENEIIKNCGHFGINDTSWNDFKKYFMDTYLIFN